MASVGSENFLEQLDVTIEIVVNLRRGKCRRDAANQIRRIRRRVDAIGNALQAADNLLPVPRKHEVDENLPRVRMRSSEERRVGEEGRSRRPPEHSKAHM